jgi:hypothetical protein
VHDGVAKKSGGELIELGDRRWDTPTVIRIAGCEQATLLQWRRKYGFLGGAEPGRGRVGYKHSVVEICSVCTAVVMIEHGLDPADACSGNPFLTAQVMGLLTGELQSSVLGFHRGSSRPDDRVSFYFLGSDQTLGEIVQKTPAGVLTLVDLSRIIDRVLNELGLTVLRGEPTATASVQ